MPTKSASRSRTAKEKESVVKSGQQRQAQLDTQYQQQQTAARQERDRAAAQSADAVQRASEAQADALKRESELPVVGDHVVILSNDIPPERRAGMEHLLKPLHLHGAHNQTGRVTHIESTGAGRVYTVDGPTFTHKVPEVAIKRADLHKPAKAEKAPAKKKASKKK